MDIRFLFYMEKDLSILFYRLYFFFGTTFAIELFFSKHKNVNNRIIRLPCQVFKNVLSIVNLISQINAA